MGLDLMADIVPFDLAGSLQAHNQLLAQRQQLQDQNALAQAVPLLQSDPQNAFATAARTSPNAALKLLPYIKQMDDEKKAKLAERTDALGKVALTVEQYKDPVIRKAVAMSMLPDLAAHGITADDLQRGDWSDNGIQALKNMPQTMGQLIAQSNADRTYQAGRSDHADTLANEVANRNVTIRGQNMTDARAKEANSGPKAWEVLTDPKTNTQFRYNPVTGQSTTLDGKQAYSPERRAEDGRRRNAALCCILGGHNVRPRASGSDSTGRCELRGRLRQGRKVRWRLRNRQARRFGALVQCRNFASQYPG
jgi:hypothetical protein